MAARKCLGSFSKDLTPYRHSTAPGAFLARENPVWAYTSHSYTLNTYIQNMKTKEDPEHT